MNTIVTTIYPVTPEQKQAFILDSSLATISNWSASPLTPLSLSYIYAYIPAFIFPLSLKWSLLGVGIHLHPGP